VSSCIYNFQIPVNVTNCNNVGSISLKLGYDPTKLIYTGYKNAHPALAPGNLVVYSSGLHAILLWSSPFQAANVGNDTLIEFEFKYLGSNTNLSWDISIPGNCQYKALGGGVQTSLFIDGYVESGMPIVDAVGSSTRAFTK